MAEMLVQIEQRIDAVLAKAADHFGVTLHQVAIAGTCLPAFHGIALHHAVGSLAADPGLRQRQQKLLLVDEATKLVKIGLHGFGIDNQRLNNTGKTLQRKIQRNGRIGAKHTLNG